MKNIYALVITLLVLAVPPAKSQSTIDWKIDSLQTKLKSLHQEKLKIQSEIISVEDAVNRLVRQRNIQNMDSIVYVKCAPPYGCAILSEPRFSSDILVKVSQGTMMKARSDFYTNEYFKVMHDGITGYVFDGVLEKSEEWRLIVNNAEQSPAATSSYGNSSSGASGSGNSSGHTIHTGPRGGKYYINSNGKKTYIKKP